MTMVAGYRLVKDKILQRIHAHAWPPGSLLPGEIDLAAEFAVARGTVNRAMRELTEEGYLDRRRKGGTRVRPSPLRAARFEIQMVRAVIEATGARYGYTLLSRREVAGPSNVRERLGLSEKSMLLHLRCLHSADGKPFQVEDRWINLAVLPAARQADFTVSGPNEWLVQTVPYSEVEIRISATAAFGTLAKQLEISDGTAIITTLRTTWLNGRALTHVRLHFHAGYEFLTRY